MGWGYRVVEEYAEGAKLFDIREVYHNADGSVAGIAPRPLSKRCDSIRELREVLRADQERCAKFLAAVAEPVVSHDV